MDMYVLYGVSVIICIWLLQHIRFCILAWIEFVFMALSMKNMCFMIHRASQSINGSCKFYN